LVLKKGTQRMTLSSANKSINIKKNRVHKKLIININPKKKKKKPFFFLKKKKKKKKKIKKKYKKKKKKKRPHFLFYTIIM